MSRISKKTVAKHKGIFGAIKNKIIDKTSDVLAIPARLKSGRVQRQANYDVKVLKDARADKATGYEYNPNEGDHTDPKFRNAVNAIHVRSRRMGGY